MRRWTDAGGWHRRLESFALPGWANMWLTLVAASLPERLYFKRDGENFNEQGTMRWSGANQVLIAGPQNS
ncbi:MAG: hypothetical protein IT423_20120 [Pirellulaceae bacterium]|nr:hypothetical protein [Pirellulaceae bacterium]